jgi:hypothetical protein
MSTVNSLKAAFGLELLLWLLVGDIRIVIVAGVTLYAATWGLGMIRGIGGIKWRT